MTNPSKRELDLTGDLMEFAKATALKEAKRRCPQHIPFREIVQDVLLDLITRPPKYDPTKGASEKTLLHTAIRCLVSKRLARERKQVARFEPTDQLDPIDHRKKSTAGLVLDDILRFIDCQSSRVLCRLFVECNGNRSQVARQLSMSEGAVRNRLKLLKPKLLAAGFNPDDYGEFHDNGS